MVSPLELSHHRGIAAVPLLQGDPERTFALNTIVLSPWLERRSPDAG